MPSGQGHGEERKDKQQGQGEQQTSSVPCYSWSDGVCEKAQAKTIKQLLGPIMGCLTQKRVGARGSAHEC